MAPIGPATSSGPIARLLVPRSVAIVGARPERVSVGGGVLSNLLEFAFRGDIHLVSRSQEEVRGIRCVRDIADLPEGIDVAVLAVPFAAMTDAVKGCIARGVGAIIVYASGFAEAGEEGRAAQDDLARRCQEAGVALLGPNCMGLTNYVDGISLTFEPVEPVEAGAAPRVAIIAQSGATAANIRFAMQARAVSVAHVVATGNEALLGAEDFVEHALEDPATDAIAAYVEQVRDPGRFLRAARRAREVGKPLVVLHPGSSERARKAAQSHTGALAGNHAVMQAMLRSEGVAVVDTLDEMFDTLAILVRFPSPRSGRAGIITNSGAIRGLAFDFCDRIGLELAELSDDTVASLRAELPDYVHVDNPLDVGTTGFANPGVFGTTAAKMLADPDVSAILSVHAGGSPPMQMAKADAFLPVVETAEKPLIFGIIGDDYPLAPGFMEAVRKSGVPFFRSPERAMRAMKVVADVADARAAADERSTRHVAASVPAGGPVTEHMAKGILAGLGIRCPRGALAQDPDEAARIAGEIGSTVVMKAQAARLLHKSDAGGVLVGLRGEDQVRDGWDRITRSVAAAAPDQTLDGILVEEMAPSGLEMVVGARRDPEWGPIVLVGLGGVWIEVIKDTRLMPADISRERAIAEVGRLKGAALLGPFRGQPARDVGAVADAVVALGALMRANPHLMEAEINPLSVHAEGQGATALDAMMIME